MFRRPRWLGPDRLVTRFTAVGTHVLYHHMKKILATVGVIIAVCALAAIVIVSSIVGLYNGLVSREQGTRSAWGQVENVYQRRYDLIPNLVETVKAAAAFERETLTAITQARASVGQLKIDPKTATQAEIDAFQTQQQSLGTALSRLLVVSEKYPELKANANFRDLQAQLEGTENRITVERQAYNLAVQGYNTGIQTFPANVLAGMFRFTEKPYFKVQSADATNAVKVSFGK